MPIEIDNDFTLPVINYFVNVFFHYYYYYHYYGNNVLYILFIFEKSKDKLKSRQIIHMKQLSILNNYLSKKKLKALFIRDLTSQIGYCKFF